MGASDQDADCGAEALIEEEVDIPGEEEPLGEDRGKAAAAEGEAQG